MALNSVRFRIALYYFSTKIFFSEIAFRGEKTMSQRHPKCTNSITGARVSTCYLAQQEGKFTEVKYKYSKMS